MKRLSLENYLLRIEVLPSIGGKIISLQSVRTGEEFLLPPIKPYNHGSSTAEFNESDGGGFDECLPSVASCESTGGLPPVADHGDLWRQPWEIDSQDGAIVLHADATSRPLRLTRKASLHGASLVLDYELVNLSDEPTSWLWSAHPLLRVAAGDRILLPDKVQKVSVEYSAGGVFEKDSFINWPTAQSQQTGSNDLSKVGECDGITAHKLFAQMEPDAWAALYRTEISQGIVVRFDGRALPFLGLWICLGAWPDFGTAKQYTVALEPTTSNADSHLTATKNGTAGSLAPREKLQWKLEFHLLGASDPIDLDDFRNAAATFAPRQA
jgi:galactose mutarotase-like enzyme